MCGQFALHHKFRIDSGRTKFGQKTDGILHICGSYEQGTQSSSCNWPGSTASCTIQAENVEETSKHCVGSKRRNLSSIKHDRTQSSFTTRSQLIVSRRLSWWELEKSHTRKYMHHLDLLRRFPLKTTGRKNWAQKLLEVVKAPNKPKHRPQIHFTEQVDLFRQQPSGSSAQEIDERFLLGCESTSERTGRFVYNCVPVSVERVDQDKDADENVDADHVRTRRHVSGQPTGSFTQREETELDFRVSGLPHAVVKQAENFRVRELVKKIESHPHRRALQADLQKITSTTHSVKNQKWWFVTYEM